MAAALPTPPPTDCIAQVVGYLNFSSGLSDPATLSNLNRLHGTAAAGDPLSGMPPWLVLGQWLQDAIESLEGSSAAFADLSQARQVRRLVWSDLLPSYLDFHRDLLFHQEPEAIFNGFFLGRCVEAVLSQGGPWDETERIVADAIGELNDFVGYRPVAQLENREGEPYPHEWVRPIPLFIAGAGVAEVPYQTLIRRTLDILRDTDASILRAAHFDLDALSELAFDPRAYDFDHPVNRRPNYHFGQWDPNVVDGEGRYRRFVLQQVTVDALLSRVDPQGSRAVASATPNREELMDEAAAVLAGTMLMASGVSGWGPAAHDSTVTLASLMAPIARYRDAFYDDLLRRMSGPHAERLRQEAEQRRQPFGAARQHLNAALATRRAKQLQHVHLARTYARMGYPDAATRQADVVPVASARLTCRIDCLLTLGLRDLREGRLGEAAEVPRKALDLIHRGIECGALVDPWNILGFGGNFARFHGPESATHDHRVDDLVALMEQYFGYLAAVWSEAAARDDAALYEAMERQFEDAARWWRRFAAHTVESLQAVDPLDSFRSARLVARALRLWHRGGAAAGDVKFWAPHAELFDSPRAYALVVDALLHRDDFVASMALLVHWLSHADTVGLRRGSSSLPQLAERWLARLRAACGDSPERRPASVPRPWSLVRKFFDYLEANAEDFWSAPVFLLGGPARPRDSRQRDWDSELDAAEGFAELESSDPPGAEADEGEGLFDAAYEGVTYSDTTDDGVEGAIFEYDEGSQDELESESKRLSNHLTFLASLSRLWVVASDMGEVARSEAEAEGDAELLPWREEVMAGWARRAAENRSGLLELLDAVRSYEIRPGGADGDSMTRYDRRRLVRDALIERIIAAAVDMSDARRLLAGVLSAEAVDRAAADAVVDAMGEDDRRAVRLYAALIAGNAAGVVEQFPALLGAIQTRSLLYIPLSRGGDPVKIVAARLRQRVLIHLLQWLPRRGHFVEACRLIETARVMEQQNPIGPGAVTEFDGLFRIGFRSLVSALVQTVRGWKDGENADDTVIPLLEKLTETLLGSWLAHSRTLRLSALEAVAEPEPWQVLVEFIRRYGDPVFTQTFLKLSNVRAILHQGVGRWLERLLESPEEAADWPLVRELDETLPREVAEQSLSIVFEAILDHHTEYRDYNSTTTQSDRGELLYTFLDFLRLRVRYDRIAWNLRPVMWAHEILVRHGMDAAATIWRRSLSDRIGTEADVYVHKLRELQQQYAMQMPTVADRILERFVQPMTIDRLQALVEPAIEDAEGARNGRAFHIIEQEADLLTRHPTGAGLDVPAWLLSLDEEVETVLQRRENAEFDAENILTVEHAVISRQSLEEQLASARRLGRRLPYMK
ncbi:hypothetical protein [Candidatus Laterigemmans baculatus]|uniref:hypothetical protein n=1 Tax=Candidatus Laterigemmans baculatus TaxID=2770505 RepID=UPI0013DD573E|nr:hypothetical protein [Candidatus Laterigemmans baculatus]